MLYQTERITGSSFKKDFSIGGFNPEVRLPYNAFPSSVRSLSRIARVLIAVRLPELVITEHPTCRRRFLHRLVGTLG